MPPGVGYSAETPKGHYDTDVKVPESVIEEIRELGMGDAIKKAKSGNASPEFIEGVRRFYPAAIPDIEESVGQESTSTTESKPVSESRKPTGPTGKEGGPIGLGTGTPDAISRRMKGENSGGQAPTEPSSPPAGPSIGPSTGAPPISPHDGPVSGGRAGAAGNVEQRNQEQSGNVLDDLMAMLRSGGGGTSPGNFGARGRQFRE